MFSRRKYPLRFGYMAKMRAIVAASVLGTSIPLGIGLRKPLIGKVPLKAG